MYPFLSWSDPGTESCRIYKAERYEGNRTFSFDLDETDVLSIATSG